VIVNGTWVSLELDFKKLSPTCKFGYQLVPATFRHNKHISCKAPWSLNGGSIMNEFFLTFNKIDFIRSPTVLLNDFLIHVSSIYPDRGNIKGGTQVALFTVGPIPSDDVAIYCKFGSYSKSIGKTDKVRNAVICKTMQAERVGRIPIFLKVGLLGNWHDIGHFFKYEEGIVVTDIFPKVLKESGGEPLYIEGEGFNKSSQLYCRFGSHHIAAYHILTEMITCEIPPLHAVEHLGYQPFMLSLTSNFVDYYEFPGAIRYVQEATNTILSHPVAPQ
jgi:hypothetical protein